MLKKIAVIWQIPLSISSFIFYHFWRYLFKRIYYFYFLIYKEECEKWRPFNEELLSEFGALPMLMTSAPRWNPHAIIARIGPLAVEEFLQIHTGIIQSCAKACSIVIYGFPRHRTITYLGTSSKNEMGEWETINLKSGKYEVGIRYYDTTETIVLPQIKIDGKKSIPQIEAKVSNEFYKSLIKRNNIFYKFLHYYMYHLIEYKKWFPKRFVESEFLPMGNPETKFYYGIFRKGQSLGLKIKYDLLKEYTVGLALLVRESFPVEWYNIKDEEKTISNIPYDGFYVIRIHAKISLPDYATIDRLINVSVF